MDLDKAKTLALDYLQAMERRDLDAAAACLADAPTLTFPGGRVFGSAAEIAQNSSGRYRFVGKRIARCDAWPGDGATCVLVSGTLYGEWPDGAAFEDIRFVDRFDIVDGRILRQDVWNDAGERVLAMREAART